MIHGVSGASIAVEGALDEAVLRRILSSLGIGVLHTYGKRGKDYLRARVRGYNAAARYGRWVLLVDLNEEAECAPPLVLGVASRAQPKPATARGCARHRSVVACRH